MKNKKQIQLPVTWNGDIKPAVIPYLVGMLMCALLLLVAFVSGRMGNRQFEVVFSERYSTGTDGSGYHDNRTRFVARDVVSGKTKSFDLSVKTYGTFYRGQKFIIEGDTFIDLN